VPILQNNLAILSIELKRMKIVKNFSLFVLIITTAISCNTPTKNKTIEQATTTYSPYSMTSTKILPQQI